MHWTTCPGLPECMFSHAPWRHAHFDQELLCRHSEVRPVVRGSGRRIRFTSLCQWQRAVSLFVGPAAGTCMHDRKKKKEEEREAEAERKSPFQRKTCTKTNSCNPKVTVTDKSSKERLRWPVSSTGCSPNSAVFEYLNGELVDDGTKLYIFGKLKHRALEWTSKIVYLDQPIMSWPSLSSARFPAQPFPKFQAVLCKRKELSVQSQLRFIPKLHKQGFTCSVLYQINYCPARP